MHTEEWQDPLTWVEKSDYNILYYKLLQMYNHHHENYYVVMYRCDVDMK